MKITSPAFADKVPIPVKYTCKGPDISPPLEFLDVPKETKSMVIVVEDIDSPKHFIHWLVYNIDPVTTYFEEGKVPEKAVDGITYAGKPGYSGPCPKNFAGIHRYTFRLYALDTVLEVPALADFNVISEEIVGHVLETSELTGVAEGEEISHTVDKG